MDRGDPGGGQRTAPNVGRRLAPTGGPPLKDSQGPNWVVLDHVVTFHDLAIENHGGRHGLRSQGLLEQAITRPQRRWYYEGIESLARIAACYTASIVFIHPFVDGNKRTGWGTARMFTRRNGLELVCPTEDSYRAVLGFAASTKDEHQEELLAEFVYEHLWPRY